ncbi:unnamed protein product, partial [marine sediment metagenome]
DNDKYANQVYTKQFGEANHYSGDVRGVDTEEIPDFDLLCAGFPCQSFSVAGKGKGFHDTRGTLFYEISRIAEAKRPQTLLLENVKGLLSNDRGQTFKTILQELGRIGYWTEWQILNSKHHGVPQNRERVFIIGHLRNGHSRAIFPIGETNEITNRRNTKEQIANALQSPGHASGNYRGMTMVLDAFNKGGVKEEEAYSLKTNPSPTSSAVFASRFPLKFLGRNERNWFRDEAYTLDSFHTGGVAVSFTNPHDSDEERRINLSDTSRTVKPPYGNQQPLVLRQVRSDEAKEARRKNVEDGFDTTPWDKMETAPREDRVSGSLTQVEKDNLLLKNMRIRRLTPVECELLQSFPKNWTKHGICKKGDIVWTGKYRIRVEIDEDGFEVTRYRPIMTKAKEDGVYPITDTNRYKFLGNAITVNVIEFLGKRILAEFTNNTGKEE